MKLVKAVQRRWSVVRTLLALVVPAGVLVAVFTYLPHDLLRKGERLGFSAAEIGAYSGLFDRRATEEPLVKPEIIGLEPTFDSDQCLLQHTDAKWHPKRFVAEGCGDSVEVRRLRSVEGGWVLKFPKDALCRGQRQWVLIPATVGSIRAKYIEQLATELGIVCPEVSFVKLTACGEDLGVFLKEERIDAGFMERHQLTDGALFTQGLATDRPDHFLPAFEDDTLAAREVRAALQRYGAGDAMDSKAAASVLFLQMVEERHDLLTDEGVYAYRWTTAAIQPLYRAERSAGDAVPVQRALLGAVLGQEGTVKEWDRIRSALIAKEVTWAERWAAMDKAWLPVLRGASSTPAAQAEADRIKYRLLERIRSGDPATFLGPVKEVEVPPVFLADADKAMAPSGTGRMEFIERMRADFDATLEGDTLVFGRGAYVIKQDLIVPTGLAVRLNEGARLFLSPGVSLLVNGPLQVRGTRMRPVFIRAAEKDKPFGTVAVNGDGTFACSLHGLQISGGSEARINGLYHSAMLSIHHADVVMDQCIISGSQAEDAFNLKNGHATIRDCVFEDGHADLVDLDFVKGEVSGCTFRNGRTDSNGDGLDVSGSQVLVSDCRFIKLLDKGISVGEASQVLVLGSTFEGNRLGMAVKDLSVAHVSGNLFKENATVFGVYRKKAIHGGAVLMLYTNEFVDNAKERDIDALSRIEQKDAPDAKVWAQFGVNE
jgi:hypothetical protein